MIQPFDGRNGWKSGESNVAEEWGPIIKIVGGWYTLQTRLMAEKRAKDDHVVFTSTNEDLIPLLKSRYILAGMAAIIGKELKLNPRRKIWDRASLVLFRGTGRRYEVVVELQDGITLERVIYEHSAPLKYERMLKTAYEQNRDVSGPRKRNDRFGW